MPKKDVIKYCNLIEQALSLFWETEDKELLIQIMLDTAKALEASRGEKHQMATKLLPCSCESNYQDHEYGKQQRVHNSRPEKHARQYVCTVCGKVKQT